MTNWWNLANFAENVEGILLEPDYGARPSY